MNMTEGQYHHLGPKTFWVFIILRSLPFLFLSILTFSFIAAKEYLKNSGSFAIDEEIVNLAILSAFSAAVAAFFLTIVISWLEYIRFKFMLEGNCFRISRGVLTSHEMAIPYRHIHSVDLKQSLLFQLLGVGRITIETIIDSGTNSDYKPDHDDQVMPVVDYKLAVAIQEELSRRANVQRINVA